MRKLEEMLAPTASGLMRGALEALARRGVAKAAIYGGGQHTRRVEDVLRASPVALVGVVDDDAARHGSMIAGLQVMSAQRAVELGATAVVLSSDAAEDALWTRTTALRAKGIEVVRLYAPATRDPSRGLRIMYYPAFGTDAELGDQWRRMVWYLSPLIAEIDEIVIPIASGRVTVGERPSFMDRTIDGLSGLMKRRVRFVEAPGNEHLAEIARGCDAVMAWKNVWGDGAKAPARTPPVTPGGPRIYRVDHLQDRRADTAYLHVSEDLNPTAREELAESREKFERLCAQVSGSRHGYVFGTGPSLSAAAMRHDFSDGVTIACNSMVKNDELMRHLRPVAVTAADPIFHSGCSTYAAEFRRHLARQMHELGCWLVVPWRDYRLYMAHMEAGLRERIVGIPMGTGREPNVDLRKKYELAPTANVLTLMMLPLAFTWFDRVSVMGCDGRPPAENKYFWSHDPKSQIADKMDDVKRAHPSFFAISYDDYYIEHCETLRKLIEKGERGGKSLRNLTASYIPVLAERMAEPVGAAA